MTNAQRTVTTMLAVVAVMLGLNLIVRGSPPAMAQVPSVGPVQPTVVAGQTLMLTIPSTKFWIWRYWDDGMVDVSLVDMAGCNLDPGFPNCGPNQVIPGTCMADVDRDGEVAVPDLLTLLAAWGACP